jgi:hypothetical protein
MAYTQTQKISGAATIDFGQAVAIQGYYAIASDDSVNSYFYVRGLDGIWSQTSDFTMSGATTSFGDALDIGNEYFIVGDPAHAGSTGRAGVFSIDAPSTLIQTFTGVSTDTFGDAVAISDEYILIGAQGTDSNKGEAYLYIKGTGATWTAYSGNPITPTTRIASDFFGSAVAISGDTLIIGAEGDSNKTGAIYIFEKNDETELWEESQKLLASDGNANDRFGEAISASGVYFVAGASSAESVDGDINAGAAYIYKYGTSWSEVDKLVSVDETLPAGDNFGESVDINGDYIIIGSPEARSVGVADIFYKKRSWGHLKKIVGSDSLEDDTFGAAVSISGRFALVGAPAESTNGAIYFSEDPQVRLRLAQEFEVNSEYLPTKASAYLKRVGKNTNDYWPIYNTAKTVIDATNFSTITGLTTLTELSPIVQYKMNDNAPNTIVVDSQGFSNGEYWPDNTEDRNTPNGKINGSLFFQGGITADYINTKNSFQSTFRSSFSINFWHELADGVPANPLVFFGNNDADSSYVRLSISTGDLDLSYEVGGNIVFAQVTSPFINGLNPWHMMTCIVNEDDASNVTVKIYKDGVEIASSSGACTMSSYTQSDFLTIGTEDIGGPDDYFSGDMDNFCIFDKTLTQEEIDFLYNNGNGTEALSGNISEIIFEDTIGDFTGNGYMIAVQAPPPSFSDYKTLNYPVRAITSDTYNLWMRVINTSSNSLEMEVLVDGNVSKTISTTIDDPSDGLQWSWISTTLILPDTREHILGIRMKGNSIAIDKIYIDASDVTPYSEGPGYGESPYLTLHMQVYDSEDDSPGNSLFIYDYKNSIDQVVQSDWYNFNINALDNNHGYTSAANFAGNYFLVMSSSGTTHDNFVVWEMADNDEYMTLPSAFRF